MSEPGKKPKDFSNPTFNLSDLIEQTTGGGLRWLASILAVAAIGLFIAFRFQNEPPEVHFPLHLKGDAVYWTVGGAGLLWTVLAIVNWISWTKRRKSLAPDKDLPK